MNLNGYCKMISVHSTMRYLTLALCSSVGCHILAMCFGIGYLILALYSCMECLILALCSGIRCHLLSMCSDIGRHVMRDRLDENNYYCVETAPHSRNSAKECDKHLS